MEAARERARVHQLRVWLFVHLTFLVGFENRLLVLIQWAWNYFTRNRRARLITGEPRTPALTAEQSSERKTALR